jgi:hypothetical protein
MVDFMSSPVTRCPWCSALLPDAGAETCPSCNATLAAAPGAEGEIKGVTTLDTDAIIRARSEVVRPKGNRFLSFITGEVPVETAPAGTADSLARPDNAVRREMLRLQLEAERAEMEAETVALKSDELTRMGVHLSQLGGDEPAAEGDAAAEGGEGEAAAGAAAPPSVDELVVPDADDDPEPTPQA